MESDGIKYGWDKQTKTHSQSSGSAKSDPFLKGPIPLWWLQGAARLGKRPLVVGLALWFQLGVTKRNPVILSNVAVRRWGMDRYGKYRALRALEKAGLVAVENRGYQSASVKVLTTRRARRSNLADPVQLPLC